MKRLSLYAALLIAMASCTCPPEPVQEEEVKDEQVLRHVVLFEWNDSTTVEKRNELIAHFESLQTKIDVIKDFEYGSDVSVEGLTKGYTHCFIVTFENEEGRDIYLPHPDHKVFGDSVVPHLKNVLVIDYITK